MTFSKSFLIPAALAIAGCVLLVGTIRRTPFGGSALHSQDRAAAVVVALRRRLDGEYLSYHWVVCVPMDRAYAGHRVWRCNVDFGDPHIVQYCAILVGRRLVTDRENRALNCAPVAH